MASKGVTKATMELQRAMMKLHTAILRDRGEVIGSVSNDAYDSGVERLAEVCGEQILMALAGSKSTHLFPDIMSHATNAVLVRSNDGTVCPCCGGNWH